MLTHKCNWTHRVGVSHRSRPLARPHHKTIFKAVSYEGVIFFIPVFRFIWSKVLIEVGWDWKSKFPASPLVVYNCNYTEPIALKNRDLIPGVNSIKLFWPMLYQNWCNNKGAVTKLNFNMLYINFDVNYTKIVKIGMTSEQNGTFFRW